MQEPVGPDVTARPRENILFIQGLRGLAAFIVVWAHVSGYWVYLTESPTNLQTWWTTYVALPLHIYQDGGHLGVVVFFLISGYIITHASLREGRRDFALKRLLRIFPALWVGIALSYAIVALAPRIFGEMVPGFSPAPWWRWLSALVLGDGFTAGPILLSVTWTLVIEIAFYISIFLIIPLQRARPLATTWMLVGAWVVLTIAVNNIPFFTGLSVKAAPTYLGLLILGRAIYLGSRGLVTVIDAALLGVVSFSLFLMFTETYVHAGFLLKPYGWGGLEPLVTYCGAVVIFFLAARMPITRLPKALNFLGDVSYSMYVIHIPVGFTTLAALEHWTDIPGSINTLIALAVVLAASAVSYKFLEQPFQRLARKLTKKPSAVTAPAAEPEPNS